MATNGRESVGAALDVVAARKRDGRTHTAANETFAALATAVTVVKPNTGASVCWVDTAEGASAMGIWDNGRAASPPPAPSATRNDSTVVHVSITNAGPDPRHGGGGSVGALGAMLLIIFDDAAPNGSSGATSGGVGDNGYEATSIGVQDKGRSDTHDAFFSRSKRTFVHNTMCVNTQASSLCSPANTNNA